jgi:DUF971 family protein
MSEIVNTLLFALERIPIYHLFATASRQIPSCGSLNKALYTVHMAVINPKSVKVNVTTGTGMDIEWDDGHHTHFGFQWLRDACPCATCNEERTNHHRSLGEPAKQAASLLPMYKEPAKPKEVKPVGRYALNIAWNDGHASGIYSWDYLREICQCDECRMKAAS